MQVFLGIWHYVFADSRVDCSEESSVKRIYCCCVKKVTGAVECVMIVSYQLNVCVWHVVC